MEKQNIWYCMAGKVENKNYYLLWWSDKQHFPHKSYNCLGLSDEDNSVSQTDNFVNVNVFNSVTSSRVLSYQKSKLCKKRRISLWNYRSPYLKCRPSWVTAHAQFYQFTFMAPKCHSHDVLDVPWSLGRKLVFCTFLHRSSFLTGVHILYPVRNV